MTQGDRPRVPVLTRDELARRDLRAALLTHERVLDALLALDAMRDDAARYHRCLTLTAAVLRIFALSELDYLVSVVRERRHAGTWGLVVPVGDLPKREHPEPVSDFAIDLAVEALARRLDAARGIDTPTDLDLHYERSVEWVTVRKAISRLTSGLEVPAMPATSERSRRRHAASQRQIAEAERKQLDALVAEGELYRWPADEAHGRDAVYSSAPPAPQRRGPTAS